MNKFIGYKSELWTYQNMRRNNRFTNLAGCYYFYDLLEEKKIIG